MTTPKQTLTNYMSNSWAREDDTTDSQSVIPYA